MQIVCVCVSKAEQTDWVLDESMPVVLNAVALGFKQNYFTMQSFVSNNKKNNIQTTRNIPNAKLFERS